MIASAVITIGAVLGQTVLAILSGFAFGVLGVAGQKVLFPLILFGLMISAEVFIIPLYYTFQSIGLTNSWLGLIIIQIGMGVPFGAFWMRATFRAVPAVADRGRRDGRCAELAHPLADPAARSRARQCSRSPCCRSCGRGTTSSSRWSSSPTRPSSRPPWRSASSRDSTALDVNLLAAGSLIVALPVLILYAFFQRHFIGGVLNGALKE